MFDTLIIHPITNTLVAIYQLLLALHIPYALGFAIILLTVVIRFLLYPLIASQMRASKKMQDVQPHISRLKEKHKNDAQMLQQETMKLYKEFGINPIAGCLPILIQLPILWGLYSVLNHTVRETSYQAINKVIYFDNIKLQRLWDTNFFGINITQDPATLLKTLGVAVLLVPLITGALQFIQSKMMLPSSKPVSTPAEKKGKEPDFASAMQMQTTYVIPVMIGFFSYTLPIGLSLYWNTFTIFGIIQQYLMQRRSADTKQPAIITVTPEPVERKKKKKK